MKMVIIASSPRVGSSLISELLTQADAGYVAEHFNLSVHVPRVAKENNLKTLKQHFEFITQNYSNHEKSIFTAKCHFDHFFNYSNKIDIFSPFAKTEFIQIKRRSSLDQAISYFLAKATNTWSTKKIKDTKSHNKKVLKALQNESAEKLHQEIVRMEFRLTQNEAYWDFYLKNQRHHTFYYENLLTVEGMHEAEDVFSKIYQKNIKINHDKSSLKIQRDNKITMFLKDKIAPYTRKPPHIALFDSCLKFNNNFYGYGKV